MVEIVLSDDEYSKLIEICRKEGPKVSVTGYLKELVRSRLKIIANPSKSQTEDEWPIFISTNP